MKVIILHRSTILYVKLHTNMKQFYMLKSRPIKIKVVCPTSKHR